MTFFEVVGIIACIAVALAVIADASKSKEQREREAEEFRRTNRPWDGY